MVSDLEVKRQLIQARKSVKRKLQALKDGAAGQEFLLSKAYEPITKSIRNLKTELTDEIKDEMKKETRWSKGEVGVTSTPTRTPSRHIRKVEAFTSSNVPPGPSLLGTEHIGTIDTTEAQESPQQTSQEQIDEAYAAAKDDYLAAINSSRFDEFLGDFDPLPRYYIEGLIKDFNGEYNSDERNPRPDKIRYEWTTNKFFIGDSEITFQDSNLCIGHTLCYKGSSGLYELLFKMNPIHTYSIQEKKHYADILKRTSALYSFRSQNTKISGRGVLLDVNDKPVEYVYFDDVNELCERLKLLIASQDAGNTNHSNEIVSILEELRECGIIE